MTKKVLIAIAMDSELKIFMSTLSNLAGGKFSLAKAGDHNYVSDRTIYNLQFENHINKGTEFVVAICGKARQVYSEFPNILSAINPTLVINIGCAGSYEKFANLYDVVLNNSAYMILDQSDNSDGSATRHNTLVSSHEKVSEHIVKDVASYKPPASDFVERHTQNIVGESLDIDYFPKLIPDKKFNTITDNVTHFELKKHWAYSFSSKGFCCDQEAAYIGAECKNAGNIPFMLLKGISDYCADKVEIDGNSKLNQSYAVFFASLTFIDLVIDQTNTDFNNISKQIESAYLVEGLKKQLLKDETLSKYDNFLSNFISTTNIANDDKRRLIELRSPAQSTVDSILKYPSKNTDSILVTGDYWSGRTLFCCLVYRFLLRKFPESGVFPIYINFAKHLHMNPEEEERIIKTILSENLDYLKENHKVAIILTRSSVGKGLPVIWEAVKDFIETHQDRIQVICIGLEDQDNEAYYKEELDLNGWEYLFRVNAIEREELLLDENRKDWLKEVLSDKYDAFMEIKPPVIHAEIIDAVKRDIYIPDMKNCNSWFSFVFGRVKKYCSSKLGKRTSKKILASMGELAFESLYDGNIVHDGEEFDGSIPMLTSDLSGIELNTYDGLGSFAKAYDSLAVHYYCNAINEFKPKNKKSTRKIEKIFRQTAPYNHMTNELFKGCMNDTAYVANPIDFTERLIQVYNYLKNTVIRSKDLNNHQRNLYFNGLAHCCYLIGRVENEQATEYAQKFLIDEQRRLDEIENEATPGDHVDEWLGLDSKNVLNSREYRLFRRSIYISLMYLERDNINSSFYDGYLDKLFEDSKEDELNRIFHIKYYASTLNSDSKIREDHIEKAIEKLWLQAKRKLESTDSRLLSINIFTVFSVVIDVAYSKDYDHNFQERLKNKAIKYSEFLVANKSKYTNNRVKALARFVDFIFSNKVNPQEYFFWLLGRFKHIPRTGWVERDLTNFHAIQNVESVAAHTYSAQFLARTLLNDEHKKSGVDKELVIKLLWAHDIPEAIVGDRVDKGDKEKAQEIEVAFFISCFGLLPKMSRDITQIGRLVQEFDKGDTPSAFAARQLDRLENYLQLINYGRKFSLKNNVFTYDQEFADSYQQEKNDSRRPSEEASFDENLFEHYQKFLADLRKFDADPYLFKLFDEIYGVIPQRFEKYQGSDLSMEFEFEALARKIKGECSD